jgi:3-methyladenine DNA glycosylase AlkD
MRNTPAAAALLTKLHYLANIQHAAILSRFFKTGPGQYGEGDVFIGVKVPALRKFAKEFTALSLTDVECLLQSEIHEARLVALLLLIFQTAKADTKSRKDIFDLYLANTNRINNWDLVDISAPHIVGAYLSNKSRRPLYKLARSASLWERRISILSTFHFIRQNDFGDTLSIAELLLRDKEDLIHKAVGWLLREIGKRELDIEEGFLKQFHHIMPRTMLRYAIEKFPERKRLTYLKSSKTA